MFKEKSTKEEWDNGSRETEIPRRTRKEVLEINSALLEGENALIGSIAERIQVEKVPYENFNRRLKSQKVKNNWKNHREYEATVTYNKWNLRIL